MVAWWESLSDLERVFACAAIPSTVLLLVQSILLMMGIVGHHDGDVNLESDTSGLTDAHVDMSMDADHDIPDVHMDVPHDGHAGHGDHVSHDAGLRILTMRGLIALFSVGGWTGLALLRGGMNRTLAGVIAVVAGVGAMVLLAILFRLALRLQSDGSMDLQNAVGAAGTVYLTIPANCGARGKVMVMLQGQLRELDAVTEGDAALKTGSFIQVVGVLNSDTLVVAEASKVTGGVAL